MSCFAQGRLTEKSDKDGSEQADAIGKEDRREDNKNSESESPVTEREASIKIQYYMCFV